MHAKGVFWMRKNRFLPLCLSCLLWSGTGPALAIAEHEQNLQNKAMQYFQQGLAAEQAGDLHAAQELFRKSIGQWARFKEVHYKLGLVSAKLGNNDEAMGEFRQALNIDNNFVQCRNDYALFQKLNKDNVNEAMNQWKQCTMIDPKYPFPYFFMGQVLHEKGDLDGAINNFETVTRLAPNLADAHRELGLCIFERAQSDDIMTAAKALEASAKLAPDNPMVHYHLGFIYATKGDLDAAESEIRIALNCEPRLAIGHWELARLRYLRGDIDHCLQELKAAEKVNPTYTAEKKYPQPRVQDMKQLRAKCIEAKGKLPEAIEAYLELGRIKGSDQIFAKHIEDLKKKIKLIQKERKKHPLTYDPEEIDALVSKGEEQFEDGDLAGAKASYERALELNPNSLEATMGLCSVQEAMGDLNAASASNQKAILINPEFAGAYYNYAYLLEKMNLPTDAGMMYAKFQKVEGKYPYDPQHVIKLQQDLIRQQKIEENQRSRGY